MKTNLNIFVIHYTALTSRKNTIQKIENIIRENTNEDLILKLTVIEEHDPESINTNNIKNLINISDFEDKNNFYQQLLRNMSIQSISNVLKHFKAIQLGSKTSNEYVLCLEDDVEFSEKIFSQIDMLIKNTGNMKWDIIFLGQPSDSSIVTQQKDIALNELNKENLLLPCIDSYLMTSEFAQKLIIDFFPIKFMTNIQFSYLINKNGYNTYKIFPNITGDGSKMGLYPSTVLPNNILIFNEDYKYIYTTLEKNNSITSEVKTSILKIFEKANYQNNPDFIHLHALLLCKLEKYEESEQYFEKALELYKENKSIINNTSSFIRNYMSIYKHKEGDKWKTQKN